MARPLVLFPIPVPIQGLGGRRPTIKNTAVFPLLILVLVSDHGTPQQTVGTASVQERSSLFLSPIPILVALLAMRSA